MKILFTNYHVVSSKSINEKNVEISSLKQTICRNKLIMSLLDTKHHLAKNLIDSAEKEINRLTKELARIKTETNSFEIGDDFKIRVITRENSKFIQETLFGNSIGWNLPISENKATFLDKLFLIIEDGKIYFLQSEKEFEKVELPEFTLDQFRKIYKVTPKVTTVITSVNDSFMLEVENNYDIKAINIALLESDSDMADYVKKFLTLEKPFLIVTENSVTCLTRDNVESNVIELPQKISIRNFIEVYCCTSEDKTNVEK